MSLDPTLVMPEGPWTHRMVAANGARFHVALLGPEDPDTPLVVLLHGFGQFWRSWRGPMGPIAEAGYRVAAMDLRGYGASDKPRGTYDLPTLTADVAGVIRSLGADDAVVVGHGLGGQVTWSLPALHPGVASAIAVLASAHPAPAGRRTRVSAPLAKFLAWVQVPWFPENALVEKGLVGRLLQDWSGPAWTPSPEDQHAYTEASRMPFVAHSAMEQLRWLVRSRPRMDGREYVAAMARRVDVPVLSVHGRWDRISPARLSAHDGEMVTGPYARALVDSGHFLTDEAPDQVAALLLDWLGDPSERD